MKLLKSLVSTSFVTYFEEKMLLMPFLNRKNKYKSITQATNVAVVINLQIIVKIVGGKIKLVLSIIMYTFLLMQAHRDFHVPSNKCKCSMRNFNRHKLECEWARKVLFEINQDFRKLIDGELQFPKLIGDFPDYFDVDKR